jgi:hypothetical protein
MLTMPLEEGIFVAAKWTVMVYMAGFNDLSEFAEIALAEMRRFSSTDEVLLRRI